MIRTAQQLADLPEGEHKHVTIRSALPTDIKFLDSLQRKFSEQVGFLPLVALEAYIGRGCVSIALENDEPAAYLLGKGNYQRDPHFGIIYQAAVSYDARRRLIGTALVQHFIDHMEPEVRLVGLWCAQDIEANEFWSACGFEAIAARRGSKRKGRVHIFWQRRIDRDDARTELRHPGETSGGLMREKRVVLPIEAGQQWKEFRPEDFPDAPETPAGGKKDPHPALTLHRGPEREKKMTVEQLRRLFVYGVSEWIWLIINGVGRYLPVVAELDVPAFMDLPGAPIVSVSGVQAPRSRIPGL